MQTMKGGGGGPSESSDSGDGHDPADHADGDSWTRKELHDRIREEGGFLIEKKPFADLIAETERMARELGLPRVHKPTSEAEDTLQWSGSKFRQVGIAAKVGARVAARHSFSWTKLGLLIGKRAGPIGWGLTAGGAVVGVFQRVQGGASVGNALAGEAIETAREAMLIDLWGSHAEAVYRDHIAPRTTGASEVSQDDILDYPSLYLELP